MNQKTPIEKNVQDTETSAYRSYKRRENQRNNSMQVVNTEALEKFSTVVELVNANKVTKMNAFEYRMIDFIGEIFKGIDNNAKESEVAWQKYSTGIDSCGKIYGFCVDFIHTETFKIRAGLNRTENLESENGAIEEEIDVKKKKKKKPENWATLEKDPSAITTSKFEKFETFDTYFKLMSSKFDASNCSALLLNNLSLDGNIEVPLGDVTKALKTGFTEKGVGLKISNLLNFDLEEISNGWLCKALEKFGEMSDSQLEPISLILDTMNVKNEEIENSESEATECDDEDDINESPTLNRFVSNQIEDDEDNIKLFSAPLKERIKKLNETDDYSFFRDPKISAWGGFDYWKKETLPQSKKEKQIRKKKEFPELVLDPNVQISRAEVFAPPKKGQSNSFSDAAIKRWEEACQKLPEDYGFTLSRLTQLFTRPSTQVKCVRAPNDQVKNVIIEQDQLEETEADSLFAEEISQYIENPQYEDLKLTNTSKNVDIKLLKETIWDKLESDHKKITQNNTTFLQIIEFLPNKLPKNEVENLSIHSCFITMLHLANEHNLIIEQTAPCDFIIKT